MTQILSHFPLKTVASRRPSIAVMQSQSRFPLGARPISSGQDVEAPRRLRFGSAIQIDKMPVSSDVMAGLPSLKELKKPVAVVVVGGNATQLVIVHPNSQSLVAQTLIPLGSKGKGTGINPQGLAGTVVQGQLHEAFKDFQRELEAAGILPEHPERILAVATGGVRQLGDSDRTWVLDTAQKQYGIPLKTIDGHDEADFVYRSVLTGQPVGASEPVRLIEIGGASTEIASGRGVYSDSHQTVTLLVGGGSLGLSEPFDLGQLQTARNTVSKAIHASQIRPDATLPRLFMNPSAVYHTLATVHLAQHPGEDLLKEGLSLRLIQHYLSPEGLQTLKTTHDSVTTSDKARKALKDVPAKLLILEQVLLSLGASPETLVRFGSPGGMKMGVMAELIEAVSAKDTAAKDAS